MQEANAVPREEEAVTAVPRGCGGCDGSRNEHESAVLYTAGN